MSNNPKLLVSLENGVKRITFNRPERRNAVDTETMQLLKRAIEESATDESTVVIFTGAGDIKKFDVTAELRTFTSPTILGMRSLPKPIIARVHGAAAGVGCSYALASDIIIASSEAKFVQAFIKIGLMPDGAPTYFLPRAVGYARAFELMATGDVISADDALKIGMINRVVPVDSLDAEVDALAARLAEAPPIAMARMKAGLNHGLQSSLAEALEFEAVNQDPCFHSEDFIEGVTAFLQKRKASFKGK